MALILKDRVKESSSSSGTGSVTLGGAFPGYQTFNASVATGSTVYYTIHNLTAGSDTQWEVGVGTFTSPATLSRDTVFSSSSSGSKVNFTAGASGLEVFITQPAGEAVYINDATGRVEAFGNGANTIAFTNINASNIVTVSGTISTNAANATDITNKQYVDGLFSTGISYHDPVLVEEDTALNAVYVQPNGAGNGVGATLTNNGANAALVVDGVSVSNTARILVYAQANAVQNGVYTVTNPGNATAQWVLTRATDANTYGLANPNTLGRGDAFFVTGGNTGAGRTYICNTSGTITFGSTNITFAQISTAQIYAAGTGLNLSNLTFSVANTAVTAAQYGNDGAVGQFTVNAQGQLTNAANVSINASSITLGTLANGRTTASASNGASTIVSRDANGAFAAGAITGSSANIAGNSFLAVSSGSVGIGTSSPVAKLNVSSADSALIGFFAGATKGVRIGASTTSSFIEGVDNTGSASYQPIIVNGADVRFSTSTTERMRIFSLGGVSIGNTTDPGATNLSVTGNVTAANFIGSGSAINAINASNISSGTIDNSRTTAASANGAATIVLRDSNGGFDAGAITATSISGNGVALSAINASNLTSGTVANARTTAATANGASTIVLRDAGGAFAAGAITGSFIIGDGSNVSAINGSNVTTGTVANARTTAASANGASTIVARDSNGSFTANVGTFTTVAGTLSTAAQTNITSVGSLGSTQISSLGVGTAASGTTGEIRATNNVTAYYSSDERLKDNVQVIANALAKVLQIRGVEFDWNNLDEPEDGYFVRKHDVGVIAQEIEKVIPEVVGTREDGMKAVKYDRIIPLLIEAIKELKAEVDALKGK